MFHVEQRPFICDAGCLKMPLRVPVLHIKEKAIKVFRNLTEDLGLCVSRRLAAGMQAFFLRRHEEIL